MTQVHKDFLTVERFIAKERAWRVKVFANKPDVVRNAKLRDCDEAVAALKRLYAEHLRTDPEQQLLFEAQQQAASQPTDHSEESE